MEVGSANNGMASVARSYYLFSEINFKVPMLHIESTGSKHLNQTYVNQTKYWNMAVVPINPIGFAYETKHIIQQME